MKTKSKISAYVLRGSAAALLVSCVIVALSSAINAPNKPPKAPAPQNNTAFGVTGQESSASVAAPAIRRDRTLTFADRVAFQRAIEEVYWQHRIWPKANAGPKPPLDRVMPQEAIEKKLEDYLRHSQAPEAQRGRGKSGWCGKAFTRRASVIGKPAMKKLHFSSIFSDV
jgi:hypothetical protein